MNDNPYAVYQLKDNPFQIEPDQSSNLVWAGMDIIRRQFERIIDNAQHTSERQVVLNFGPYGGGKTHASYYFTQSQFSSPKDSIGFFPIIIRLPKEPEKGDAELYRHILETIGFETIKTALQSLIKRYSSKELIKWLTDVTKSEEMSKAVLRIANIGTDNEQPSFWEGGPQEEVSFLVKTYFLENNCSRQELKKLGVARNIKSIQDRFGVLASVFHIIIGRVTPSKNTDLDVSKRVILWIDEVEDLVLYPARYHRPFTEALRDLLGRLPRYFTLVMNFTLASPEALRDIEVVIGGALLSRVTEKIDFKPMTYEEAYKYVVDLLNHYRLKPTKSETFPFTKESLIRLLDYIPPNHLNPREVNRYCNTVLNVARRENTAEIAVEFIEKSKQEEIIGEF